ncbi:hypothetical protein DLK05_16705 [Ancylomarina longa]|uniref:Uncharacterized protein n=1 Tax=Ancylomarina longa TaxID=2487017 RepID=A0A434AEK4_9BACT|nr:hypothetical protein DLK05_16705 [Ancylomarina longa]
MFWIWQYLGRLPRCAHNDSYELAHVQFVGDALKKWSNLLMCGGLKKMRAGGGVNGYLGFSANQKSR